jgi:ATP/maltotriose-dependent transcriptional regulator MalT
VLLERDEALDVLGLASRNAQAGDGRLVLISGEAGIGKSSLVEHFVRQPTPMPAAWGSCDAQAASRPLAPLYEVAASLGGQMQMLFSTPGITVPPAIEIFDALSAARPLILIFEDIHWADEATLEVIRYLGRRIQRLGILVIATYRDDETDAIRHLRAMLGSFATSGAVSRIALEALSTGAVAELVGNSPADAASLYRQTGGNPFLVKEMLRAIGTGTVPGAVREMVWERLARLSAEHRGFLEVLAVAGAADPALLSQLLPGYGASIEAGIASGLLREDTNLASFRHELTRNAVLDGVSAHRKRSIHAAVLQALIDAGGSEPARLAFHAVGAGSAKAILHYAKAAAVHAVAAGARGEGVDHYARALEVARDDPVEHASLLLEHGKVCGALGRHQAAIDSLHQAATIFALLKNARQHGAALTALAGPLANLGMAAEASARCREAIAVLEELGPSRELAWALRTEAHQRMLDRDKLQALHFGRRAILMADALHDTTTLAAANQTVGTALLAADDETGRTYLDRSLQQAGAEGLDTLVSVGYLNAGSAYAEQYHLDTAQAYLTRGISFAEEHDFDGNQHYMQAWLALVYLQRGQLAEARRMAEKLLAEDELAVVSRIMALVALGRSKARTGDPDVASVLDEALALATPTGSLQRLAPVRLARAEAAWLGGDPELAAAEAQSVWGLATGHRHKWHTGEIAYWQRKTLSAAKVPRWAATPYLLQLDGAWQLGADAWADLGCPYEQARSLADGDEAAQKLALGLFDGIGARPAAEQLRRKMRSAGMAGIPRGPRPATRQHELGLTARQAEVLTLVSAGLTNGKIAKRLNLSEKTVDHHLSAILGRLGVSTRAEAVLTLAARTDIGTSGA